MAKIDSSTDHEAAAKSSGLQPIFVWHPRVHQDWADERLHFWALHFRPEYDRDDILNLIEEILTDSKVHSYVVYEMLGFWDILLRAWVPNQYQDGQRPEETIEKDLRKKLKAYSLWELEGFAVSTMDHSASGVLNSEMSDPPPKDLLDRVDRYNSAVLAGRPEYVALGDVPPLPDDEWDELATELDPLHVLGQVSELDPDIAGVKFAVSVGNPIKPLQPNKRDDLYRQIRDLCSRVQSQFPKDPSHAAPEISIYSGSGELGTFLILAKAPDGEFYDFVRQMVFGLRRETSLSVDHMRPFTHVIAYRRFLAFHEHIVIPNAIDFEALVEDALSAGIESEVVEFKATWRTDLKRYLATGDSFEFPSGPYEIVKAICGLLNTPQGGVLIIGVAEMDRFKQPEQDKARALFPSAPSGLPVPGFELEKLLPDVKFESWDQYRNAILQSIDSSLDNRPGNLLSIAYRMIDDRTITIVSVRPSKVVWFHAKSPDGGRSEFFVRESGRTQRLEGMAADDYRRANPRGSRA